MPILQSPTVVDTLSYVGPQGLAFTLLMGLLLVVLPRRYALAPIIILTCYMTMGQAVVVLGLHFTMIRLLALFGWVRLLIRGEFRSLSLTPIDKALLWWTLSSVVIYTLMWQTPEDFVNRLGFAYNAAGMYFLFRFLVRDVDDIHRIFKMMALFVLPLAAMMLQEWLTGRNVFAVFGGVHEITQVRDGVMRCQGPFAHPILAGTFGASLLPYFVALWHRDRSQRLLAVLAIVGATVITITSGSSGPILTYAAAVLGLAMWGLRRYMRTIRRGLVLVLVGLHMVMKAPVWFLIARVDVLSGSTGFHRAYLIDRFIATFSQWWFLGMKGTEAFGEQIHDDITNTYVVQGIGGGLLTLILFILIIVLCFRGIGLVQALPQQPTFLRRYLWAMGVSLFAHVVTFLSITYFDQNFVNWYLLLAMISMATGSLLASLQRQQNTQQRVPHLPMLHYH
jgi:hypothetical protein